MADEKLIWVGDGVLRVGKREYGHMEEVPMKLLDKKRIEEFLNDGLLKNEKQIIEDARPKKKKESKK
jgi:hypothetical protein